MTPLPSRRLAFSCALGLAASTLLVGGCTSLSPVAQTKMRIQERPTVFNDLTPKQQDDIRGGAIERNYTKDQVYLALGRPKRVVTSADGKKEMWVFVEHYTVGSPVSTGFNGPNSSHYVPTLAGSTSPGANVSVKYLQPMDNSTTNYPFMSTIEPPELRTKTVYVFFFEGRVAEIKLDGDASDQEGTALNKLRTQKKKKPDFPRSGYEWEDPDPTP